MNSPKRILNVVTIMNFGGIETFLMTLYRNIDRDKIQFDFLVHREEKGFFDDEILSLGGKIIRIRPLDPFKIFPYIKELKYILQYTNYDIIHSHLNANTAFVLWIAKIVGIKHRIAHSHITENTGGFKTIVENLNRLYINSMSTNKMACSDKAGKWLFGYTANFKILNNSIDVNKFCFDIKKRMKIRKELKISVETIVIGNIARFDHQKNHSFLIDVFFEFTKSRDTKLLLIGEGDLMADVKRKINRLGIEKEVIFIGAVNNANEYLNAMDVFLFPSHYEGLGIVAVEAQTNGLPVIMNLALPDELDLTDLTYRLSLSDPIELWCDLMLAAHTNNLKRESKNKIITEKSYDVKTNVSDLEIFYLGLS
jgi:glycosyltransferase involved in cell wall biosynthesis